MGAGPVNMRTRGTWSVQKLNIIFFLVVIFSGSSALGTTRNSMPAPFGNLEVAQRIQDLFIHDHNQPDREKIVEHLFEGLEEISERMPESFQFDFKRHGPPPTHPRFEEGRETLCMRTPNQFKEFLHRIQGVMTQIRQEQFEDSQEQISREVEDTNDSTDKMDDTSTDTDTPDFSEASMDDFSLEFSTRSTSAGAMEEEFAVDPPENPSENLTEDADDTSKSGRRQKRSHHLFSFDLDETLDRMQDDDVDCLTNFFDVDLEDFLCHRYARRSVVTFAKLVHADVACDDILLSDDDDHETELDMAHQMFVLDRLKQKSRNLWTDDDITKVMMLAPDAFDDDILDELSDDFFQAHLQHFGRLAARKHGNPLLRYAFREKINKMHLGNMSSDHIRQLGPGLLSLTYDQIDELDGFSLLESDIDDIFDKTIKPHGSMLPHHTDEDDDDDDDDDARFSLGRLMKQAYRQSQTGNRNIARALHFLHDDMDFVQRVEPEELVESLNKIRTLDYDDNEASLVYHQLSKAQSFPSPRQMSALDLTNLGHLVRGMAVKDIKELRKEALEDALSHIHDIDFDDVQAAEILDKLVDDDEVERLQQQEWRRFGRLLKGIRLEHLERIDDDIISDIVDDFDDIELDESVKRMIAQKVRHAAGNSNFYKFMELDDFADVVSLDDVDQIDLSYMSQFMNTTARIKWKLPQATALVQKFKETNPMNNLRISHLPMMGHMVRGLTPRDLDNLVSNEDEAFDIAEALENVQEELTSAQIDQLVDNLVETTYLDNKKVTVMDSYAMQGSPILAYLDQDHFDKLDFTTEGKKIFMSQVAKMPTSKMSRNHMQFLAKKMLNMLDDIDDLATDMESRDEKHSRQLRNLGHMALGLTPTNIRAFSGKAIIDNLDILRTLPLSKAQALAVLDRVRSTNPEWKCRSDMLSRVGPLLQHVELSLVNICEEETVASFSAIMKDMEEHKENFKDRIEQGFARENDDAIDDDGMEKLVNAMITSAFNLEKKPLNEGPSIIRRRRASKLNIGKLTCDLVKSTRGAAKYIGLAYLSSMRNTEFENCLANLGSISDWDTSVIEALANKMKTVYGSVSLWSPEVIRRAGSIVSGLSPSEILQLQIKTVDTLHSIGKHGRLNTAQLNAGFRRWLKLSGTNLALNNVTGGELSSMSEFVCGLEPADVAKISIKTFKQSLDVIGSSRSCPPEVRSAYLMRAISIYGDNIKQWSPALVGEMGHLLGGMTEDHIKKLSPDQIALVQPTVIQHLPPDGVKAMTSSQLMALSTNQANAVTQAAYDALEDDQRNVINEKATVAFLRDDNTNQGDGGYYDGDNGGSITELSILTLSLSAIVASLLSQGGSLEI